MEGQELPRGYGIAYWKYWSMTAVCYPIPLNFLISLCHTIYFNMKRGIRDNQTLQLRKAYERGLSEGYIKAILEKL